MAPTAPEHPIVGALYRVETALLSGSDPKPKRPAVVVALPAYGLSDVSLLARTSNLSAPGIKHEANDGIGCTLPGVFGFRFVRSLDVRYFAVPQVARYLGMVEEDVFARIMTWWEKR